MASSFTTTQHQQQYQSQHTSNLAGPDIKLIASSFVKQYYTLLNKAPCFIHNFYNHDSTFIHGTIEMGNEHHTEPVVGREQIEKKMKELKLNDCRAKIKQIDCLETLAGGLVIQVIGELSNNGRPMRRFLQTFVLAPSLDQARHDGDSRAQMRTTPNTNATTNTNNTTTDNRRSVQISENSTGSSHNQKFYVLNSIFRYQDDGPESEFEDDSVSAQANTSIESANGATDEINDDNHNIRAKAVVRAQQPTQQSAVPTTATTSPVAAVSKQPTVSEAGVVESSKRAESGHTTGGSPNGTVNLQAFRQSDKKIETSERALTENGKFSSNDNKSQVVNPPISDPGVSSATATSQGTSSAVAAQQSSAPTPKPSNEPKTWANMVRNALPPSSTVQAATVSSSKEQQLNSNQAHPNQNNQQNPQSQTQQNEHNQNAQNNNANSNNNNNNNNNRRRHMIRKPSNKTGNGRTMKNRNPRPHAPAPTIATPVAPTGKPTA